MLAVPFELAAVPDLFLTKYATLGVRGVDGALRAHLGFLRLFAHRPNTSLHLFYAYDPSRPDGARLSAHLVVAQDDRAAGASATGLSDVGQIVLSSELAHVFDLVPRCGEQGAPLRPGRLAGLVGPRDPAAPDPAAPAPLRFSHAAALSKTAAFMRTADSPDGYLTLPAYEQNDAARLSAMMRLMGNLNLPCAYRVDLYPTERATSLRDSLPLADIWARRTRDVARRDYALERVERSYEDLLSSLEGSPLFHLDAVALAQDPEIARALLDAAASEAVSRGGLTVGVYEGSFDPLSLMSPLGRDETLTSLDGRLAIAERRDPGSPGAALPGFVQTDVRARGYAHCDVGNLFTLEQAASLFRLPALNDGEAVQLRKETAPRPVASEDALLLGADAFGQRAYFEMGKLSKHAFIAGVPGSGKTNTMHHVATSLVNRGVPILVLEPAKHEYRAMLNAPLAQEVRVFSPGGELSFPLRVNPLQIPVGVTVGQHISRLCTVFGASFPLTESMPFLLDRAVEAVYVAHGWRPKDRVAAGDERSWPTLSELYEQMRLELEKESYAGEVKGNLAAALRVRIGGLLRRELGELFDVPVSTFEPNEWLRMSAIMELEALGRSEANFLTLLMLVLIRECLMVSPRPPQGLPVRHVIFIEEAHNLVAPEAEAATGEAADPKKAATAFLSDMLREVRAYGEGIVIADQLPTAIAPEVLKNTGLKVGLRMTSSDDRQLLGSMMAASGAQLERMATANPGDALVLYEGLQRPFEIRMAAWLVTPGTREYVADPAERRRAATSLPAAELRARLVAGDAPWYRQVRLRVPRDDARAFEAALDAVDRRFSLVLTALARLRDGAADAADGADAYARLSDEVDQALHVALGTSPVRADGSPRYPDLTPVLSAYEEARRGFDERARGWAGLGMPAFERGGSVSAALLAESGLSLVEGAAVCWAVRCQALYAERVLALLDGGPQRFGMYRGRGGARLMDETRASLQSGLDLARMALPLFSLDDLEGM